MSARRYGVKRVQWPFFGGDGFIAGLPVALIRFDRDAQTKLSAEELFHELQDELPDNDAERPRWLAMQHGDGVTDNDLLVFLRTRLSMLTYFETSGRAPMCDNAERGGRLAMYDHVCVRMSLPCATIRTELFHSIVALASEYEHLRDLSTQLDKRAFNGPRYVASVRPKATLRDARLLCHSSWRITRAIV